ncbi:aconitate hydratase [Methylomarinovum caldicuralii]|uniref:Aconitate hydratase n=1 Tax=Methylomarinovum caldicuralii TaxID=438856 RepID=A0AAU9CK78_9GAMM|nr:aconitate hydratase AcnA [Methylomarinovum caldicuralii]BCX82051.1 aconitate hydratase [Methylomarinovum caldicuralii]
MQELNPFGSRIRLRDGVEYFSLEALERAGLGSVSQLPFSIKVLLESVLRNCDGRLIREQDVAALAGWKPQGRNEAEIPFMPARVLLQDFTGVPALVDLAAMRSAMARFGKDPARVEPLIPAELVVDHSIQVDYYASPDALEKNMQLEFRRNLERYQFLKWGQQAFQSFKVIPPGVGIVHQVNLEYLARGVFLQDGVAWPDSLVGTDSHTTMINGLGIVGWGVGGIEAEAGMLGQPLYMLPPEVIGFELTGELPEGATATDLVLRVTEMLRRHGVVGKFVEFYGSGLSSISVPDRTTVANMAPEYGATIGFFPIDAAVIDFLRATGRPAEQVALVEDYCKAQGLFRTDVTAAPRFTETLSLDLSTVEPSLAGPRRPQDRVTVADLKASFEKALTAPVAEGGFGVPEGEKDTRIPVTVNGREGALGHGSVVIAAITSCTNTSNPSVMLGAGLLAKKAAERGLVPPATVKTSLAPGSRVVTEYLRDSGLQPYLDQLGFYTVGYGCTTCIGNSGPLPEPVAKAIRDGRLVAAAVLSGNRNFEGRVHPLTRANYLASPPLVVAYALAGTIDIDLTSEPLGNDRDGKPVYLRDIWPSRAELAEVLRRALDPDKFHQVYEHLDAFNPDWNAIEVPASVLYDWPPESTYIQEPPFFKDMPLEPPPVEPIEAARVLVLLGDSVTTDHISPAGVIPEGPAAEYLRSKGVDPKDFNTFGARRGNHEVMMRGTFANVRLRNLLVPDKEGGVTRHLPDGEEMWIFDAAMRYRQEGVPLIVIAGKDYGMGSSRDWAAKGPKLLGVRAVIAESFERIHRSNLVGMGILPLTFKLGQNRETLGLSGRERYTIPVNDASLRAGGELEVTATADDGGRVTFPVDVRLNSAAEVEYYRNGGILHTVLRGMLKRA